jgi:hypothetical protein
LAVGRSARDRRGIKGNAQGARVYTGKTRDSTVALENFEMKKIFKKISKNIKKYQKNLKKSLERANHPLKHAI